MVLMVSDPGKAEVRASGSLAAPDPQPASTTASAMEHDVDALHRAAYQAAYRLTGSREDAQDLAQEALTRLHAKRPSLASSDHAAAWVTRVATNLALDRYRKGRTARRHAATLAAANPATAADPFAAERVDLGRALLALPRRQREVVALRYLADRSEADTAAALGISTGAVKKYAAQGLAALRTDLTEPIEET